jgi:beta-lactamase regulating signal transducer with metallopeptidase domain
MRSVLPAIKYNDRMNELSKEDIEFCLLHEEGHLKNPVKIRDWLYLLIPFLFCICIAT